MTPSHDANNAGSHAAVRGPIDDLLRLQTDFQQRLASETLRYLRQLQGLVGPVVPGTLVLPDPGLELQGRAQGGDTVTLQVTLENRQRVHCLVSPMLSPLVSERGVTWFVEARVEPGSALLAEGDQATIAIAVPVPAATPPGSYRGAVLLPGFEKGALPVRVIVEPAMTEEAPAGPDAQAA
ncbi:MAG TPA: hypothetical protein VME92_11630 [Acetobacteraceae bacterium]|nr:hypothetical protein [Acetobacteraceae bacterium]